MPSFWRQLEASRETNRAVRALESAVRARIELIFAAWAAGEYTAQSVRWALEAVIRNAYRSSAAVGLAHLSAAAGIPQWRPKRMNVDLLKSSYLDGLLDDVRRNLREYKASPRDSGALKKAITRISYSASVATGRGHTDALVRGARELAEDYGFNVRKVWQANFVDHVPCEICASLHGTSVGLNQEFAADSQLRVYGDLKGPPRHPNCMCWIAILIEDVENYQDDLDDDSEFVEPETLTTDEVKKIQPGFFVRVVRWLRTLVRGLKNAL